jgi:hypothetical protein
MLRESYDLQLLIDLIGRREKERPNCDPKSSIAWRSPTIKAQIAEALWFRRPRISLWNPMPHWSARLIIRWMNELARYCQFVGYSISLVQVDGYKLCRPASLERSLLIAGEKTLFFPSSKSLRVITWK